MSAHGNIAEKRNTQTVGGVGVEDPRWVKYLLIGLTVSFLTLFVVLPTANVFAQAFGKGWNHYVGTFFAPKPAEGDRPSTVQMRKLGPEVKLAWDSYDNAQKNWKAIRLTLMVVLIVVPLGAVFGLAAAWAITRFKFTGRTLLLSLIDLPFSVSPVVSGLIFVLVFGARGIFVDISRIQGGYWLIPFVQSLPLLLLVFFGTLIAGKIAVHFVGKLSGESAAALLKRGVWALAALLVIVLVVRAYLIDGFSTNWAFLDPGSWKMADLRSLYWRGFSAEHWWPIGAKDVWEGVIYTPIAVTLATIFVTFPFIARTLIPVMAANGSEEEVAAVSLGASGWQMFWRVTIPNAKWGLFYGVILCTARACGEFGAARVVSSGTTNDTTMPLRIERLWEGTMITDSFAMASVLTVLALATLGFKALIEWRMARANRESAKVADTAEKEEAAVASV